MTPHAHPHPIALMVEDNPVDVDLARELFGYHIECSRTLAEAVERIRREHPRSILLDLDLPNSVGTGTVRSVRAEAPDAYIVVWTGADPGREAVLDAGADMVVMKDEVLSPSAIAREFITQQIARHVAPSRIAEAICGR